MGTSASQRLAILICARIGYESKPTTTRGLTLSGRSVCWVVSSFISIAYWPVGLRGSCVGVKLVMVVVVAQPVSSAGSTQREIHFLCFNIARSGLHKRAAVVKLYYNFRTISCA